MDPATAGGILALAGLIGRWAVSEYRWFKSSERAARKEAKKRRKLSDAAKSGSFKTTPIRGRK